MKNIIYSGLFLLLTCQSTSFGQKIIFPSNITRSYLSNFKNEIICKNDSDCPSYSYCDQSLEQGVCVFLDFLCPEDENVPCHYQSDILWSSYDDNFKPITNTCTVEEVDKNKCKTKQCTSNNDCFSEKCYQNTCVTDTPIYKCTYIKFSEDNKFECGKMMNMKCNVDEDCSTFYCKHGFCKVRHYEEDAPFYLLIIYGVLELVLSILGMYAIFNFSLIFLGMFKKTEHNAKEKEKEKEKESLLP